jgi:hypothetical protein
MWWPRHQGGQDACAPPSPLRAPATCSADSMAPVTPPGFKAQGPPPHTPGPQLSSTPQRTPSIATVSTARWQPAAVVNNSLSESGVHRFLPNSIHLFSRLALVTLEMSPSFARGRTVQLSCNNLVSSRTQTLLLLRLLLS